METEQMQSFVEGEGDRRWLEVVRALGESFQFLFNIDCDTGVAVAYRAEKGVPEIDELIKKPFSYGAVMKRYIDKYVLPEDRSKLVQFADAACLRSQLSSRRSCVMHYRVMLGRYVHSYCVRLVPVGEETAFTNVIAAVSCEDETAVSERGGARADWSLYPAGILPPCFHAA